MKPKWQRLASLAQKYAHSSFSSLVQSLLPKDTLLRTHLLYNKMSHKMESPNYDVFSLKIAITLTNNAVPDEMHFVAFYLCLHCLPNYYSFRSLQCTKS